MALLADDVVESDHVLHVQRRIFQTGNEDCGFGSGYGHPADGTIGGGEVRSNALGTLLFQPIAYRMSPD